MGRSAISKNSLASRHWSEGSAGSLRSHHWLPAHIATGHRQIRSFIEVGFVNMRLAVLFIISCGLFSARVSAEGGCPPGQVPQQGQGWGACVPIAGSNHGSDANASSDTPKYVNSWQAVASDDPKGILGTAVGRISRLTAEDAAIDDCRSNGGTDCQVKMSHGNGCIAMVVGAKAYQLQNAASKDKAERAAMNKCRTNDSACSVYYSECSFAKEQ